MATQPPVRGPFSDEPGEVPRDPRHRPVVLYVSGRQPTSGNLPSARAITASTCLFLVSLLGLTLFSGWAGWRVADSDAQASDLSAPNVPRGPVAERMAPVGGDPPPATSTVGVPEEQPSPAVVSMSAVAAMNPAPPGGPYVSGGPPTAGSRTAGPTTPVHPVLVSTPAAPTTTATATITGAPTTAPATTAPAVTSPAGDAPVRSGAPSKTSTPPPARATGSSGSAGEDDGDDEDGSRSPSHPSRSTGKESAPASSTAAADGERGHHHDHGSAPTTGHRKTDDPGRTSEPTSTACPSTGKG